MKAGGVENDPKCMHRAAQCMFFVTKCMHFEPFYMPFAAKCMHSAAFYMPCEPFYML